MDPASLALSILGLASLLSTCIEYFELVQVGRHHSQDYEILFRKFQAQRVRLIIWGMATGIIGTRGRDYNHDLDQPLVYDSIKGLLNVIKLLFEDGDRLVQKYGMRPTASTSARQNVILRETFELFKLRLSQNQHQASLLTTTKWAVTDKNKFEKLVSDVTGTMDALQQITESVGALRAQREILRHEIDRASRRANGEEVEVLQEAALETRVPSRLLVRSVDDLGHEDLHQTTRTTNPANEVELVQNISALYAQDREAPTRMPEYPVTGQDGSHTGNEPVIPQEVATQMNIERYKDFTFGGDHARQFIESTDMAMAMLASEDQSLLREVVEERATVRGGTLTKRLRSEYSRFLNEWPIPFVSYSPINHNFRDLMGIVRGPPDSPYEGGIFFVRIYVQQDYPMGPLIYQFLTKVYHPNIDEQGRLCNIHSNWSPAHNPGKILACLSGLLSLPQPDDPLRLDVAAQYIREPALFSKIARAYTTKYATGTRPTVALPTPEYFWWDYALVPTPTEPKRTDDNSHHGNGEENNEGVNPEAAKTPATNADATPDAPSPAENQLAPGDDDDMYGNG